MTVRFEKVPAVLAALGTDVVVWLTKLSNKAAAAQADSTAADVATLKTDFNDLLAKLRAAGLMQE